MDGYWQLNGWIPV